VSAWLLHAFCRRADGTTYAEGDPDQPAAWWSFSKTVLAAAVLRLAEQGRLDLDGPFRGADYSLRQLLAHTAGVANYGRLASYHRAVAHKQTPWPRTQLLAAAGADRLLFQPGTNWAYSNVGYLFVREAIEQASGMTLADALRATELADRHLGDVRLAACPEDLDTVAWLAGRGYHPGWVYHGLLTGGARSAVRLLDAILHGPLLAAPTRAQMATRRPLGEALPGRPWRTHGYALGLMSGLTQDAGWAVGHSGAGPRSVAAVYHFPDISPPTTAAVFTDGCDEGVAEWEAVRLATRLSART
jgi:CubicO group peptidase (beta-lactamase class C family)